MGEGGAGTKDFRPPPAGRANGPGPGVPEQGRFCCRPGLARGEGHGLRASQARHGLTAGRRGTELGGPATASPTHLGGATHAASGPLPPAMAARACRLAVRAAVQRPGRAGFSADAGPDDLLCHGPICLTADACRHGPGRPPVPRAHQLTPAGMGAKLAACAKARGVSADAGRHRSPAGRPCPRRTGLLRGHGHETLRAA